MSSKIRLQHADELVKKYEDACKHSDDVSANMADGQSTISNRLICNETSLSQVSIFASNYSIFYSKILLYKLGIY